MWIKDRIRRLFRLRFAVLYPLALYPFFFAQIDRRSMVSGGIILMLGMFIRLWSNGYAIKMGKLTVSGPYAYVRNPLYVGTLLMVLGLVTMAQVFWAGAVSLAVMGLAYRRTVCQEEKMLGDKFGRLYAEYKARVPAMLPAIRPYTNGEKWPFSFERLWESREHKVVLWVFVAVIGLYLRQRIFVEHSAWSGKYQALAVLAACMVFMDIAGEAVRNHFRGVRKFVPESR
jgi:protein-S-isoprenylcysteine O-methyltransferase Ste14